MRSPGRFDLLCGVAVAVAVAGAFPLLVAVAVAVAFFVATVEVFVGDPPVVVFPPVEGFSDLSSFFLANMAFVDIGYLLLNSK
jgi:hypothetical protein